MCWISPFPVQLGARWNLVGGAFVFCWRLLSFSLLARGYRAPIAVICVVGSLFAYDIFRTSSRIEQVAVGIGPLSWRSRAPRCALRRAAGGSPCSTAEAETLPAVVKLTASRMIRPPLRGRCFSPLLTTQNAQLVPLPSRHTRRKDPGRHYHAGRLPSRLLRAS